MTMEIDHSTELAVNGMACDRCVKPVIEELREVKGITNVEVILNSGITPKVTIFTSKGVNDGVLHEVITEAGLEFVSTSCDF